MEDLADDIWGEEELESGIHAYIFYCVKLYFFRGLRTGGERLLKIGRKFTMGFPLKYKNKNN